jgi:zeaxanthin glucosyltransferase
MTHFGIICPDGTGHINTMYPLAKELQRRGHRITVFSSPITQEKAEAAGFNFRVIGASELTPEKTAATFAKLGELSGKAAVKLLINLAVVRAGVSMRDTPEVSKKEGVEALLVDQFSLEGQTIAEYLKIPFISVCSALPLNRENTIPPFLTSWKYNPSFLGRMRNQIGYSLLNRVGKPVRDIISEYRRKWNLQPYSSKDDYYSKLAIISQQPPEFDFPRQNLPQWFHFTGPYHDFTARPPVDFPFEKLSGKPLIYASMGTLQNRLQYAFQYIAEACADLDAQLVISLGGSSEAESLPNLPGNPLVVKFAPQLELLQKATLVITHAGLNTTLESLANGVPMVAIPVTNDQPGVASRIAWSGTGEMIPLKNLSVPKLREAVTRVLTQDSYKQNALRLQDAIRRAGGVSRAADVIEMAIATGKPMLSV